MFYYLQDQCCILQMIFIMIYYVKSYVLLSTGPMLYSSDDFYNDLLCVLLSTGPMLYSSDDFYNVKSCVKLLNGFSPCIAYTSMVIK